MSFSSVISLMMPFFCYKFWNMPDKRPMLPIPDSRLVQLCEVLLVKYFPGAMLKMQATGLPFAQSEQRFVLQLLLGFELLRKW